MNKPFMKQPCNAYIGRYTPTFAISIIVQFSTRSNILYKCTYTFTVQIPGF